MFKIAKIIRVPNVSWIALENNAILEFSHVKYELAALNDKL